jgi:CheY-like chemotaxis protein
MKPESTGDARTARQMLLDAAARSQPFVTVLCDVQMPEIDGFGFVRDIRACPELARLPVIMLSSGGAADAAVAGDLGIVAQLAKPVSNRDLLEALSRVLAVADQGRAPDREAPRLRVLLAEDNPTNRQLALKILERRGHEVITAANGREAVEAWRTSRPDAVLMDVQMPELNGLDATRVIRAEEDAAGGHVRIVAMTAHAMSGDRERCLAAGMDGYLAKPLNRRQLLDALESGLDGDPAAAPAVEYDCEALVRRLGGDEELARDMAGIFAADARRMLAAVRDALEARDGERLGHAAHALKGAAANFDATPVVTAAGRLEALARAGQPDFTRAAALVDTLEHHTHRLAEAVRIFAGAASCAS